MEGAVRLFAGEFSQATLSVPGGDGPSEAWVVTPSGAYCRQVFLCGVLTELHDHGDSVSARLADPTGGFDLSCRSRDSPAAKTLVSLPCPSFISVLGRVHAYRQGGIVILSVRPELVQVIDRPVRDLAVLRTADALLGRLALMRGVMIGAVSNERIAAAARHYQMTPALLDELAAVAERAVESVSPPPDAAAGQPDVRQLVIDLLNEKPGPRGVAVQDIIDTLGAQGIFQDIVLKAIEGLIVDDECYQPQKGFIRLL